MNKEIMDTSITGATGDILDFQKDARATRELRPDIVDDYTKSVKTNYPGGPSALGQKPPLDEYQFSINMDVPRNRPADSTVLFVNGEPRYF